jgi:cytochrome P450
VLELLKQLCPVAMNKAIEYGLAVSPTIVDEDPPGHTPHRQALRRGFTPDRVAAMESRTRELVTAIASFIDPHTLLRREQSGP